MLCFQSTLKTGLNSYVASSIGRALGSKPSGSPFKSEVACQTTLYRVMVAHILWEDEAEVRFRDGAPNLSGLAKRPNASGFDPDIPPFESETHCQTNASYIQLVEGWAHNPVCPGSSPGLATNYTR